jgi:DNA-binding transcriptional MerR regulator
MPNCENRALAPADDVFWFDRADETAPGKPTEGLTLAEAARRFWVSRLTLRYYEFRGLIARRQRSGGARVYGWGDCGRIAFIVKGRRAGLTLAEMAPVIRAATDGASDEEMRSGRAACLDLIDRLDWQREPIRDALGELRRLLTLIASKSRPVDAFERE